MRVSHHVVDEISKCPHHRHADKWDAEQDDVQEADAQQVGQPHAPAVHDACVGVHLAVCRAHVHRDDLFIYLFLKDVHV